MNVNVIATEYKNIIPFFRKS